MSQTLSNANSAGAPTPIAALASIASSTALAVSAPSDTGTAPLLAHGLESPPVAAAESDSVAPALVSSIEAVARSRRQTVGADAVLVEVAARLSSAQVSVVVVCDAVGVPVGVITETVLIRRLGLGQADFFSTRAASVMTDEFTLCKADDRLSDVLARMHDGGLTHVLLVDAGGLLLGVVTPRDGLRALLAAGNEEQALLRNYVMGVGYQ